MPRTRLPIALHLSLPLTPARAFPTRQSDHPL